MDGKYSVTGQFRADGKPMLVARFVKQHDPIAFKRAQCQPGEGQPGEGQPWECQPWQGLRRACGLTGQAPRRGNNKAFHPRQFAHQRRAFGHGSNFHPKITPFFGKPDCVIAQTPVV